MSHEVFSRLSDSDKRNMITEALTDLALSYFETTLAEHEMVGSDSPFLHELCEYVTEQIDALEEMEDPGVMDNGMHEKPFRG